MHLSCLSLLLFLLWFRKDAHSLAYYPQHDLVSPATYGGEAEVSVETTDENLVSEAHPAPVLETGVRHLPHQSAALQLAHGGQLGHVPTRRNIQYLIKREGKALVQSKALEFGR